MQEQISGKNKQPKQNLKKKEKKISPSPYVLIEAEFIDLLNQGMNLNEELTRGEAQGSGSFCSHWPHVSLSLPRSRRTAPR